MDKKLIAQLVILFLLTQALGLYVGHKLIDADVSAQIVTDNPEDIENTFGLFGYILVFTLVLLAVIKFAPAWLLMLILKTFESLAIFFTSLLVFISFYESILVILLSIGLVLSRWIFSKNIWLRNLTSITATAGAGSLIGVSLGVTPVLVFLVLLAAYDLIAVFKTKHMVKLAKTLTKKNLAFTYAMPTKKHTFELGTGDMVMPLTFAVSLLAYAKELHPFPNYLIPSILVLLGSLVGLIWTIDYSSKRVGRALPALPPQVIIMLLMFGVIKLLGF